MKDFATWILIISSILYDPVMCSSDYEVYHTSGLTSDHDDYNHESATQKQYDLSGFKRISPTPKFTLSHLYVSPEAAEPHFTRSNSQSKNSYVDGYSAFLQKHFDDDDEEEQNSQYRQDNYDDDDEEVNSKYQQAPEDVEENEHDYYNAYSGDDLERIQSLPQKEETQLNLEICETIVKGKAMCKLCKDPVSGARSESCSFDSSPSEKQYAYLKQEKYNS